MNKNDLDKTIENLRQYSIKEIDRLLVYLPSGALVFSMGFVKDIIDLHKASNICFLKIAWVCFTLSLLVILLSHFFSYYLMKFYQDEDYKKVITLKKFPMCSNITSFILLFLGMAFFIIFIAINF